MSDVALFDLEAPEWVPLYRQFTLEDILRGMICRDCGRTKFAWERGCGGSRSGGMFELCDDCAALDGRGQRSDGSTDASRWGIRTTDDEAERLTALQAKRRAAYLKSQEVRS